MSVSHIEKNTKDQKEQLRHKKWKAQPFSETSNFPGATPVHLGALEVKFMSSDTF